MLSLWLILFINSKCFKHLHMNNFKIKFGLAAIFILAIFANVLAQPLPTGIGTAPHDVVDYSQGFVDAEQLVTNLDNETVYEVQFNATAELNSFYSSIGETAPDLTQNMRYFWSFGDGNVSYEANPTHEFAATGSYSVSLHATPIYSPKPPPPAMRIVIDTPNGLTGTPNVNSGGTGFLTNGPYGLAIRTEMLRNFRPTFESPMIITYKNNTASSIDDDIQVYYNSTKVDIVEVYAYQGETAYAVGNVDSDSELSPNLNTPSHNMLSISFTNLLPGETRRVLVHMVSNNASTTFDPSIYLGANFDVKHLSEVPDIRSSLRRSWDPNAKEVFEDYIAPPDFPNSIKYRIYMENVGSMETWQIGVLDRVHHVLDIPDQDAMVAHKYYVNWSYEPNAMGHNVTYTSSDFSLAGQTPNSNIEDSKYWFDVVYPLNVPLLEQEIFGEESDCKAGHYSFGKNAKITFDAIEDGAINTNTPYTQVVCPEDGGGHEVEYCAEIIKLYPNPISEYSQVSYEVTESMEYLFDAYAVNMYGKHILLASELSAEEGVHEYEINFSNLQKGIYRFVLKNKICTSNLEGFVKK